MLCPRVGSNGSDATKPSTQRRSCLCYSSMCQLKCHSGIFPLDFSPSWDRVVHKNDPSPAYWYSETHDLSWLQTSKARLELCENSRFYMAAPLWLHQLCFADYQEGGIEALVLFPFMCCCFFQRSNSLKKKMGVGVRKAFT